MCKGNTKCKKCAATIGRRRKKRNMAKKFSTKNLVSQLTDGGGVALGMVGGRIVVNNLAFLKGNPLFGAIAQVLIAQVVGSTGKRGGITEMIALGMSANAAVDILNSVAPDLSQQVGITGIGQGAQFSLTSPGVMGSVGKYNSVPNVVVQ